MWLFPLPKIKPLELNAEQMPQKYVSGPYCQAKRQRERMRMRDRDKMNGRKR